MGTARPWYQNGVASVVGNARGVPDITMSAACNGATENYQSFPGSPAGGT
jgi:subtilase family serine protease